ncbi:MAG: ferredoxin reductase [Nocardioidaceae bacterium]
MERTALRRRLTWQLAEVMAVTRETPRVRRIRLRPPDWPGHVAGQHVDVRLTAPDGYTAQRSYSIASPPSQPEVELIVERLDDGEVSPYLTDELRAGDLLEVRGPIGGYFVWPEHSGTAVQLVAGGSGVVPFVAMLAHHRTSGSSVPVRLLYSARTDADVIAREELRPRPGSAVVLTFTRDAPADWTGPRGRIDRELLVRHSAPPEQSPAILICGSTPFVEAVTREFVAIGHAAERIKTERYGGMGDTS